MENITTNPAREEQCFQEIANWFGEHRRLMKIKELRPIVRKYFRKGRAHTLQVANHIPDVVPEAHLTHLI